MSQEEFQRIKDFHLIQDDVAALTYDNFLTLPQVTITKLLVERVTDLNDQGILNGLWTKGQGTFNGFDDFVQRFIHVLPCQFLRRNQIKLDQRKEQIF